MVKCEKQFLGKRVVIRDIEERDVDALVAYWHQSSPDFLRSLGVELSKLKAPEETRRRFLASLPHNGASRERVTVIVESAGALVAYSNLNIRSTDEAYAHFHILKKGLWAKGVAYFLFPDAIEIFFADTPVPCISFQTSPENHNINRMLQSFAMTPELMHLDVPDGMARAGLFHVYKITRDEARFLTRSQARKRNESRRTPQ
jgi:RimJ/RimL family protein N-acetyltransferase